MSNIWSVYLFVCMSAFTNVYSFVVHFSAFVPFYLCLFLLLFFLYLSGENEKIVFVLQAMLCVLQTRARGRSKMFCQYCLMVRYGYGKRV